MTSKIESRYRLFGANFLDDERGRIWQERLGAQLRPALEILTDALGRLVAVEPEELDRQQVAALVSELLPGLLGGGESYRDDLPDLLEDLLLCIAREAGVAREWEWSSAVSENRAAYETALADSSRPRYQARSPEPHRRAGSKLGRNDSCPCGSGKKYKHCCLKLT